MALQTPKVGDSVWYTSYGTPGGEYKSEIRAAIVTEVPNKYRSDKPPDQVGLCVLNPTGYFFNRDVLYSPEPHPGRWSWPSEDPEPEIGGPLT
jgi:hypothetical protein